MLTTQVFVWSNSVVANGTEKNTCSSRNPNHPDPPWPDVRCHTILRNQRCTRFGQSTPHLTRRDTQPLPFLLQTNIQKKNATSQLPVKEIRQILSRVFLLFFWRPYVVCIFWAPAILNRNKRRTSMNSIEFHPKKKTSMGNRVCYTL